MLRVIANLLFLPIAVLSALLLCVSWNESSDAVSIVAITLAGSVLALALMQGQEKQEKLLERILAELQRQSAHPYGEDDEA